MNKTRLERVPLGVLKNISELVPTYNEKDEEWGIKVFDRAEKTCGNYISASRREFYEILLIAAGGHGIYTIGTNAYQITGSVIIFIHPNDIVSWENLSEQVSGYYCLFKKSLVNNHQGLKSILNEHRVFGDKERNVVRLGDEKTALLSAYFTKMKQEQSSERTLTVQVMQTYLQLIILESIRDADPSVPFTESKDVKYTDQFLLLLEKEMAQINFEVPLRIKTVKEFALDMDIHPNYLNQLLKKDTGQNASATIKNRIISEAKALLLHTDWTIHQVGFSLGFEEQSNFNTYFKKHTGVTPGEFQRNISLSAIKVK